MADKFEWDGTTELSVANLNKHLDRTCDNLARNSQFYSWFHGAGPGTGTPPTAWGFTANDGTIARESTNVKAGVYSVKVAKAAADSSFSRLYQDLTYVFKNGLDSGDIYTLSAWIKATFINKTRMYISEDVAGSPTTYSSYATASWQYLSVSHTLTGSADGLMIGFDFPTGTTYDTYIDGVMFTRGPAAPLYTPNQADHSLICQHWLSSGVLVAAHGGTWAVPWKASGTLTGGALQETINNYTIPHGTEVMLACVANPVSFGTTDPADVTVSVSGYGAGGGETTFDLNLIKHTAGNFTSGEAYDIRGILICGGWDTYTEVFKGVT
jgi:hypothetical protein